MTSDVETAIFGGGCFWCTQAIFKRLQGVNTITAGYCGGTTAIPTYDKVATGNTNYAEVIQLEFDPTKIGYHDLLEIFFATHDPTTLNQQGADIGSQYRSVIFYSTDSQRQLAQEYVKELESKNEYSDPIVTQIVAAREFYPAENYHQNFYDRQPDAAYCRIIIDPKLEKLLAKFSSKLKKEYLPTGQK